MICECYISTIIYWYESIKMKFSILYSVYLTKVHQNNLRLKSLGSTELPETVLPEKEKKDIW